MIRLPPTTIVLGHSDLKVFGIRRQKRIRDVETDNINREFARFAVGASEGPNFCQYRDKLNVSEEQETETETEQEYEHEVDFQSSPLTLEAAATCRLLQPSSRRNHAETRSSESALFSPEPDHSQALFLTEWNEEHGYLSIEIEPSVENSILGPLPTSSQSPKKDDFYYGGFVESIIQHTPNGASRSSSPFGQDPS